MSHKFIHIKYKCSALEENIKILSQTVEQGFCVSLLFGGEMFDTAEKCRSASWRSASPRGGHEAQLCAPTCSPGSCALKKNTSPAIPTSSSAPCSTTDGSSRFAEKDTRRVVCAHATGAPTVTRAQRDVSVVSNHTNISWKMSP